MGARKTRPQPVGAVLTDMLRAALTQAEKAGPFLAGEIGPPALEPSEDAPSGRYDFDLAEFPLFRFCKPRLGKHDREPLVYRDSIRGLAGVEVVREWKAYPGPFGFGGPSTQALFYELLQLYVEQGACGSQIQFGTLRSLFLRSADRHPSKDDYDRMRHDIDVLRGYDFHCKNAFWDRGRRAYVDMKWRLFGSVFYFKERPLGGAEELPFGFLEVSPVLRQIARTRGFFSLGFDGKTFHALKPLEQRLAVYLAKKFVSQKLHRRFVDDLAAALPIEASRPRDVRATLKRAAEGLLAKGVPCLSSFRIEESREGRWVAVFERGRAPGQPAAVWAGRAPVPLPADVSERVERIVRATGNAEDRLWWAQCVARLGAAPVDRAIGQLNEACRAGVIQNRGALLTKIFKDLAREAGVALKAGEDAGR